MFIQESCNIFGVAPHHFIYPPSYNTTAYSESMLNVVYKEENQGLIQSAPSQPP